MRFKNLVMNFRFFKSLKTELIVSYIVLLFVPLAVVSIVTYLNSSRTLTSQAIKYSMQNLEFIGKKVDETVQSVERVENILSNTAQVQMALKVDSTEKIGVFLSKNAGKDDIFSLFTNYKKEKEEID